MKQKLNNSKRFLNAEQQLHRMEQWKLAALERRVAELEAERVELIAALNETNALHGLFIDTTARRLGSVSEEKVRVQHERAAQALKLNQQATRVRSCTRLVRSHQQEFERDKERKELLDIVERIVGRTATSLP